MADPIRRVGGRSARVRRQVLDAATEILLKEGLDATTIAAVAERSGVHHTSIYRRWGDRTALIRDALLEAVDTAVPVRDTGSLREELTQMLDDVLELYRTPLGPVLIAAVRSSDPAMADLRRTYFDARLEHCASIAEHAKERGELPENTDHRLMFELLMGPFLARAVGSSDSVRSLDSGTVVRAVLHGITAGAGHHNGA
jgi:AcrR family transcriptional regulator